MNNVLTDSLETAIVGDWLDEGKTAKIEIYRKGETFFGKIVWLLEPNENGSPKLDRKNPDPARRNDPIVGQELMKNFVFDKKKNKWKGGTIYDAESGKRYNCYMILKSANTLKIRGYMGIPLFGITTLWTKVE